MAAHPAPLGDTGSVPFDSSEHGEILTFEIEPSQLVLEDEIGSGNTSEVYKGTWGGNIVAVKCMNISGPGNGSNALSEADRIAFQREVAIMPRINHPNLVKFLGLISVTIPFSIIFEYCNGGCAFDVLHNNFEDGRIIHLTWFQKQKMALDTASAMDYLHSFKPQIIHRDLKSLNLLLVEMVNFPHDVPWIKLSDFGLSKMKDPTKGNQEGGAWGDMTNCAGTTHWMAPEVITSTTYDEKVDLYSFSMILYEIICREVPFEDEEPAKVGQLAVEGHRPTPEAVPPDCPDYFKNLMISCWAHHPQRRPTFAMCKELLTKTMSTLQGLN